MHPIPTLMTLAVVSTISRLRRDERGVTTVEWLGMAAVVVIVVAFLLPQVRSAAADMWDAIADELDGLFG
ncbi:MAG: hypothetical protein R3290_03510 [Acidimicrobiia bacterium]|nr:hypothetical protein [Acidimicrobiia bacterium]